MASKGVFIVAARRTALGDFGKSLKHLTATDLAEHAARGALAGLDAGIVDSVVVGNVMQTSKDAAYLARHVGLRVGVRVAAPSLTVNRLCGSGFQAVVNGAHEIKLGESDVVLCGGTESMSQAPFVVRGTRFGTALGQPIEFEDVLWAGLSDSHIKMPMGLTAEKLGAQYNVTRQDADEFALKSQTRWQEANAAGAFKAEIVPIELKTRKGVVSFDADEPPRPTTAESLAKLKPVFKKDGLVTAGNASGISDGAAVLVLASEAACAKHNLTPLARLVSYAAVGCDPTIMGIGPAPAVRKALDTAGMTMQQMDLFEVNEAFAAQAVAVQRELDYPLDHMNACGGAIAIGHPLGASGARITTHLVHDMIRRNVKHSVGSACIGGGQGIALVLENVSK